MSSLETRNAVNDPARALDHLSHDVWSNAKSLLATGETERVSDAALARIMTAAIKVYAAKAIEENRSPKPVLGREDELVTATEALTAVTEILRALRLGPMEFGLWSRRQP